MVIVKLEYRVPWIFIDHKEPDVRPFICAGKLPGSPLWLTKPF